MNTIHTASAPWLSGIRRDLHKHPELACQEIRTTRVIKTELEKLDIQPLDIPELATGAVACVGNAEGPTIGLRADIDALPIDELNDVPYKSVNAGVMHACGHDCHTTIMLGVARNLKALGLCEKMTGMVKFLFQPAEETIQGARLMIDAGALEKPPLDQIMAGHMFVDLPVGKVGFFTTVSHASCNMFHLTIRGKGAHGARPHMGIDPIVAAASFVTLVQTIVSRNIDPAASAVVSIGKLQAGTAPNVIPEMASLAGTIRTFDEEVRALVIQRLSEMAFSLEKQFNVTVDWQIDEGVPVSVMDASVTQNLFEAAVDILGEANVSYLEPKMGAEDFALYSHLVPATFMRIGCGNKEKGFVHLPHSARFDVDEEALCVGVDIFTRAVERLLT